MPHQSPKQGEPRRCRRRPHQDCPVLSAADEVAIKRRQCAHRRRMALVLNHAAPRGHVPHAQGPFLVAAHQLSPPRGQGAHAHRLCRLTTVGGGRAQRALKRPGRPAPNVDLPVEQPAAHPATARSQGSNSGPEPRQPHVVCRALVPLPLHPAADSRDERARSEGIRGCGW